MKKILFIVPFLVALLFFSCEKQNLINPGQPDELPPTTTIGANTFGCLMNGEVWRPYIEDANIWERALNVDHDRGWVDCDQLYIGATKKLYGEDSIYQTIIINVWCPKLGENKISPSNGAFHDFYNHAPCSYRYHVDTLSSYKMNITRLDTENNIASGTFEFTAINNECQDTLIITEGRFDADSSL